jgi:nitrite reductase/ring-hydroxylating ferredoxin subunit
VNVDEENDVIIARSEGRVHAFSLKCPHKGARLQWRENEGKIFCPKHKARFLANGDHVSGRGSRDLDRYGVRLERGELVVDLDNIYREDRSPSEWQAAFVTLS